ncbi:MAG: HobA family DNA replication regulator [Thiovulaceae bacterium]|nr:HobA family DNA replication regulator [Sulfurimonadaceae bacterium]
MQAFIKWTLDSIRDEGAMLSWLEESRFEWTATVAQALNQILSGKSIVLVTDENRQWFGNYIVNAINKASTDRPMISIVRIESLHPNYSTISGDALDMFDDMLSLSYKDEYFFWYIGRGNDKASYLPKSQDRSFLWLMDEDYQNAFTMRSYDPLLDIKLLQLYRQFDKSLNAVLFGEVKIDE